MYIKAEYENIYTLGKYLETVANDYKYDLEAIEKKLEELGNYWTGADYNNYKELYTAYLKQIQVKYVELTAFGKALKKVANLYNESDLGFDNTLRKIGNEDADSRK